MTNQPWDKIADHFDTYKENIWYGVADNIDAVWPVILNYIKKEFPNPKGLRALDFGCGTGMFCRELKKMGFTVTGVDISEEMIKIGRKNLEDDIELLIGDVKTVKKLVKNGKFDLITSIMVLQFLDETEINMLGSLVRENGCIVFANHNPERLKEKGITDTLYLSDTNIPIPIYPRDLKTYNQLFSKNGFTNNLEHFASQSLEFIKKYKIEQVIKNPKYLILGYKKSS